MEEEDIHPFYSGARGIALAVLVPLVSLFAYQVYLDRKELCVLKRWSNIDRMYRLGGLIGTTVAVVAHVDFYGVFGIYSPRLPSILFAFMICSVVLPLVFAWYKSVIASCWFLPWETQKRVQRISLAIVIIVGPLNSFLIVLAAINEHALTRFISAVLVVPSVLIFVTGINYLYYKLRGHMKDMEAADADTDKSTCENKPLSSLSARVRSWRIYAVLMSLITLVAIPISALRANSAFEHLKDGATRFEDNINTIVSPSEPLSWSHDSILLSFVIVTTYGVLAWKSWQREHRSSASSSGTTRTVIGSSGAKVTSRGAGTDTGTGTDNGNGSGTGFVTGTVSGSSPRLKPSQSYVVNTTVVPVSSDISTTNKVEPAGTAFSPTTVVHQHRHRHRLQC